MTSLRTGEIRRQVVDDDELIWCDECGRGAPWKHKRRVSWRRTLLWPITTPLWWVVRVASWIGATLTTWADRPERRRYDADRGGGR